MARDILNEQGVEAVTLASVAGQLGMTKQALYHYFSSKEALLRGMVSTLLDDEIETLMSVVEAPDFGKRSLDKLIRAFHEHYIRRLDAFRTLWPLVFQVLGIQAGVGGQLLRDRDAILRAQLVTLHERRRIRRLAFIAWTSALGLLTMLSIADANQDPLVHSDEELLETLAGVFDRT